MFTRKRFAVVIAGILLLGHVSTARASSFTLTTPSYPDLAGFFVSINYNHTTGLLSACGYTNALSTDAATSYSATSVPCDYALNAYITTWGVFTPNPAPTYDPAGSSLNIQGALPTYDSDPDAFGVQGISDGSTLLRGNLTDFDFTAGNKAASSPTVFRFLVAVTDDPYHFGLGSLAGAIVSTTNIYVSNFTKDFSGTGYIDTFKQVPVPEPASLLLLSAGVIALVLRRRSLAFKA